MSNLGSIIVELRTAKGLTQTELAEKTGLGRRTISKIETDSEPMRLTTLRELANALDPERQNWTKLLVGWVNQQLQDEAVHLRVTPKQGSAVVEPSDKVAILKSKVERAPLRDVELVISLLENPPLMDAVRGMMAHLTFAARK